MKVKSALLTVECIGCKARRTVDEAESKKLTAELSMPMCEKCYMPMVAVSVKGCV